MELDFSLRRMLKRRVQWTDQSNSAYGLQPPDEMQALTHASDDELELLVSDSEGDDDLNKQSLTAAGFN